MLGAYLLDEVIDQQRDIFFSILEIWDVNRYDIEAVVEVLAEVALAVQRPAAEAVAVEADFHEHFGAMAAQIVAPIASGALYDLIGMRNVFFLFGCVFVVFSFVTMFFVKHGDAKILAKKGLEALDIDD